MAVNSWVITGLILCGTLTLLSLWRTMIYLKAVRRQQELRDTWVIFPGICNLLCGNDPYAYSPYFPVVQQKFVFHCLVLFSIAFNLPGYIFFLCDNTSEKVLQYLYPLKIVSYWLLFCGFCLVINLWASLVIFNTGSCWILVLRRSLVTICICFAFIAVYGCVDCLLASSIWAWVSNGLYHFISLSTAGILMTMSLAFLSVGCMLQGRICRALAPQEKGQPRFWITIARLNVITMICTFCFALRGGMLLVSVLTGSYADTIVSDVVAPPLELTEMQWYALSEWVPHYLPCLALMYLMRNAGGPEVTAWGYNQQRTRDETSRLAI